MYLRAQALGYSGFMAAAPATRLGLFLTPEVTDLRALREQVAAAERWGLDVIGIQDHPYQRRFLDAFALMGDLLARTERLTVFSDVASLPLRPPATLAKTAASLDVLSGGRFELGLGAGAFWDAIAAMGGPRRTPGESVDALEEAIEIIRASWRGDTSVRFSGRHYSASGFRPGPPPAHDMGIWVGAYKPRMLALTGRMADGWVPSLQYAPPEELAAMRDRVDAAARDAGRDPASIRRVLNIAGTVADGPVTGLLEGPPAHWVDTLRGLRDDLGFDTFVLAPQGDVMQQIERFAREVAPEVRA
jgi:alkanesulfonate monooxygenase SsuD/methylene tetrahydromethanopterin reductase-like flavin-dependent oxidoreductase (luciferase family)